MINRLSALLTLFIGLRYTRAKQDNRIISFISLSSIIGIALGVIVLIVVLSVMNGFEQGMRDRILSMIPHLTITQENHRLEDWQKEKAKLEIFPQVSALAPYIHKQMMLSKGDIAQGVSLYGVEPSLEEHVSYVDQNMLHGSFNDLKRGQNGIILGDTLAKKLGVVVGDRIMALNPITSNNNTQQGLPELKQFKVVGIFRVDMQQYDTGYAYAQIDDVAEIFNLGSAVTGLRIKLDNPYQAREIAYFIYENADKEYLIGDWTNENVNIFTAIKMQKTTMFLILMMIVMVAVFNLVFTLSMIVHDKQADIAILRTLGLSPLQIMQIFMVQGSIIGLLGTLIGTMLGILLAVNVENIVPLLEQALGRHFISPEVYGISQVEATVNTLEVASISGTAFVLALLATLYPAWQASKVQPAEALRYE
jgi:lipoprotein-releasing system permease protein